MKTVTYAQTDVHSGTLLLVNAKHSLQNTQPAGPLVQLNEYTNKAVQLAAPAAKMMRHLLATVNKEQKIVPVSGYRSREEQTQIYNSTLLQKGKAFTQKYVALPGCSEHETGLALDLGAAGDNIDFITPSFPNSGVFVKFKALAALYGFVERYPQEKCHITGIGFEPWHFRYVGWPHSVIMQQHRLVLEEYIELLNTYDSYENPLIYKQNGYYIKVFTVKPENQTDFYLPDNVLWQASGNNIDGVVMTIWQ